MSALRYLLDTNVLSDLVRNPDGPTGKHIRAMSDPDECCTSSVVACELRYGARKRGSPSLEGRVEQLLAALDVLPLGADVAEHYARVRSELERAGTPIGGNDLLIAAQALSLGLVVVTDNLREFGRVSGLSVESWSRGPE